MKYIFLLYFVIVVYQILDIWQTILLFELGSYEANPIMRYIISVTGSIVGVILFKLFFISLLGIALILLRKEKKNV